MHPLPGDERWGYPSGRSEYPLAAFHFAGDDAAEGFTLCFEDRDGQQGLHRFYDGQVRREASVSGSSSRCGSRLTNSKPF